jgi:Carboxypeptidase regulatory-like domain
MSKRISLSLLSVFLLILVSGISLQAQIVTGEISGTVTDQSGAAVGGATISAVCPDTNQTRAVTSGSGGEYRLSGMAICVYKVSVSSQGFKTTVRNVTVAVAQETKADFRLEVGQNTETITVEGTSPLVDFSSGVNNEVDTKSIVDLPTEGRDFKSILALTPGVQRTPGGGFLDVSVSGQRTTTNNYMIDGMPNRRPRVRSGQRFHLRVHCSAASDGRERSQGWRGYQRDAQEWDQRFPRHSFLFRRLRLAECQELLLFDRDSLPQPQLRWYGRRPHH